MMVEFSSGIISSVSSSELFTPSYMKKTPKDPKSHPLSAYSPDFGDVCLEKKLQFYTRLDLHLSHRRAGIQNGEVDGGDDGDGDGDGDGEVDGDEC